MTEPEQFSFVSVMMPVRNEEQYIAASLNGVLSQDYPEDKLEILVIDGVSEDRTREIVLSFQEKHPRVRMVDNPGKTVPKGLNKGLEFARGDIIVRIDGHCVYPQDYVRRVVKLLVETGAANVGGALVPVGSNYVSRGIAAAYDSPIAVGGALRGHMAKNSVRDVDAVHAGCWLREELVKAGGFDEELVRNQDDELSFRLREAGKRVIQSSEIHVQYAVRDRFRKLFVQFLQYGFWKVRVIQKHLWQANVRHFLPGLLVAVLLSGALLLPFWPAAELIVLALSGVYMASILIASLLVVVRRDVTLWPGAALAIMLMQLGYGLGSIFGALRWVGKFPLPNSLFEKMTR